MNSSQYLKTKAPVEIVCVVDKSGSMGIIVDDTIGSFNQFLEEQQELGSEANLTLVFFDTNVKIPLSGVDLQDVKELDRSNYRPGGWTALLDAVGRTINDVRNRNPKNVLFMILTDGEENSSREFSEHQIKHMVSRQIDEGWKFLYLGANQDSWKVAQRWGFRDPAWTMNFAATSDGIRSAGATMSAMATSFRTSDDKEDWEPDTVIDSQTA